MKNIHVQAQKDHITSLCTASPIQALAELIWNALDADAFDVKVDVIQNALGGIDAIRVADDGQASTRWRRISISVISAVRGSGM